MNSITQDMKFRLSLIKYSDKYGVTKAAIKYKTNQQYIYLFRSFHIYTKYKLYTPLKLSFNL